MPDTLRRHGASVDICEAYQTVGAEENKERLTKLLADGAVDVVTVTSSSAVRHFLELTADTPSSLDKITFACIGPITARTCREQGLKHILTASTYTTRGLTDCIKDWRLEKQ